MDFWIVHFSVCWSSSETSLFVTMDSITIKKNRVKNINFKFRIWWYSNGFIHWQCITENYTAIAYTDENYKINKNNTNTPQHSHSEYSSQAYTRKRNLKCKYKTNENILTKIAQNIW